MQLEGKPVAGCRVSIPLCVLGVGGQPRHLEVEDKGQPLQVFRIVWLVGVGPAQVLEGGGEVAELDKGLSTENVELYLKTKRPRLLLPLYYLPSGCLLKAWQEFDGPRRCDSEGGGSICQGLPGTLTLLLPCWGSGGGHGKRTARPFPSPLVGGTYGLPDSCETGENRQWGWP